MNRVRVPDGPPSLINKRMKIKDVFEARYGKGLSQREREDLVHDIKQNIDITHVEADDWRITLDVAPDQDEDQYDYDHVRNVLTRMYGEPSVEAGYSGGTYHKIVIPTWTIKDHKIRMTPSSSDVSIEISK